MAHHSWLDKRWITNSYICQITSCTCFINFWQTFDSQLFQFLIRVSQHRHLPTDPKYKCVFYQQGTVLPRACSSSWQAHLFDKQHCRKVVGLVLSAHLSKKCFPSLIPPDPAHSRHQVQNNASQTAALLLWLLAPKSSLSCRTKQLRLATSFPALLFCH